MLRRPLVLVDGGLAELPEGDEALGSVLLVVDDDEPASPRLKTFWLKPESGELLVRVSSLSGDVWLGLVPDFAALLADVVHQSDIADVLRDADVGTTVTSPAQLASAVAGLVPNTALGDTVATLVSGKVPASQLPSFVDDVLEYANLAALPNPGEAGKLYVTLDDNHLHRWSGSTYVDVGNGSTGTTDSIVEGTTNLYFTVARVRATALTGLSLATGGAIAAADTVLGALGKLQKQITDAAAGLAASVLGTALAGLSTASGAAVTAADTILVAIGKLQKQATDAVVALAGKHPAAGATGNPFLVENDLTVTANYTIPAGKGARSSGKIIIPDGIKVTVADGASWTIE